MSGGLSPNSSSISTLTVPTDKGGVLLTFRVEQQQSVMTPHYRCRLFNKYGFWPALLMVRRGGWCGLFFRGAAGREARRRTRSEFNGTPGSDASVWHMNSPPGRGFPSGLLHERGGGRVWCVTRATRPRWANAAGDKIMIDEYFTAELCLTESLAKPDTLVLPWLSVNELKSLS